ncbi:hypothetical protein VP01_900g2 [Puccinia sorghi]|uniref:Sec16 central conserved domain-containing protein n=1 Tax=Puccinia sorghi TaxID=27349 RepID=A0A0L6U7R4_9BASI|nr:hypothetical protein VP01_900g2 [Puccinia sorghi]
MPQSDSKIRPQDIKLPPSSPDFPKVACACNNRTWVGHPLWPSSNFRNDLAQQAFLFDPVPEELTNTSSFHHDPSSWPTAHNLLSLILIKISNHLSYPTLLKSQPGPQSYNQDLQTASPIPAKTFTLHLISALISVPSMIQHVLLLQFHLTLSLFNTPQAAQMPIIHMLPMNDTHPNLHNHYSSYIQYNLVLVPPTSRIPNWSNLPLITPPHSSIHPKCMILMVHLRKRKPYTFNTNASLPASPAIGGNGFPAQMPFTSTSAHNHNPIQMSSMDSNNFYIHLTLSTLKSNLSRLLSKSPTHAQFVLRKPVSRLSPPSGCKIHVLPSTQQNQATTMVMIFFWPPTPTHQSSYLCYYTTGRLFHYTGERNVSSGSDLTLTNHNKQPGGTQTTATATCNNFNYGMLNTSNSQYSTDFQYSAEYDYNPSQPTMQMLHQLDLSQASPSNQILDSPALYNPYNTPLEPHNPATLLCMSLSLRVLPLTRPWLPMTMSPPTCLWIPLLRGKLMAQVLIIHMTQLPKAIQIHELPSGRSYVKAVESQGTCGKLWVWWQVNPVFPASVGGTIQGGQATGFEDPYDSGGMFPTGVISGTTVTMQQLSQVIPIGDLQSFPGPLFMDGGSKSNLRKKQKEVVAWLDAKLDELEKELVFVQIDNLQDKIILKAKTAATAETRSYRLAYISSTPAVSSSGAGYLPLYCRKDPRRALPSTQYKGSTLSPVDCALSRGQTSCEPPLQSYEHTAPAGLPSSVPSPGETVTANNITTTSGGWWESAKAMGHQPIIRPNLCLNQLQTPRLRMMYDIDEEDLGFGNSSSCKQDKRGNASMDSNSGPTDRPSSHNNTEKNDPKSSETELGNKYNCFTIAVKNTLSTSWLGRWFKCYSGGQAAPGSRPTKQWVNKKVSTSLPRAGASPVEARHHRRPPQAQTVSPTSSMPLTLQPPRKSSSQSPGSAQQVISGVPPLPVTSRSNNTTTAMHDNNGSGTSLDHLSSSLACSDLSPNSVAPLPSSPSPSNSHSSSPRPF